MSVDKDIILCPVHFTWVQQEACAFSNSLHFVQVLNLLIIFTSVLVIKLFSTTWYTTLCLMTYFDVSMNHCCNECSFMHFSRVGLFQLFRTLEIVFYCVRCQLVLGYVIWSRLSELVPDLHNIDITLFRITLGVLINCSGVVFTIRYL